MKVAFVGIVALLIGSSASADDAAMHKYRNWLPRQIRALSEKERDANVPMIYTWATNTALSPLGDLEIQSNLNTLMYDGLGNYDGAKRRFQKDLGEQSTGDLTVGQLAKLSYRAERTRLTSVSFFPFQYGGKIYNSIAILHGTVKFLDETIAYPVNYVEIQCTKSEMTCTFRQLVLVLPDENSFSQSYSVMESVNETYRVTRWDDDRIDARPEVEGTCRVNELRLNFTTKEYYEFATNAPEGKCEMPLGGTLPKLEKPRVSQVVDGDPLISAQFEKIRQETYQFLSSEFRAKVASISLPATK